jgi:hypothetical protein
MPPVESADLCLVCQLALFASLGMLHTLAASRATSSMHGALWLAALGWLHAISFFCSLKSVGRRLPVAVSLKMCEEAHIPSAQ